jgi:hypothetical protein
MRPVLFSGLLLLALTASGQAEKIAPSVGAQPGMLCRAAVHAAERGTPIPPRLLAAIARVESGRPDPRTGEIQPWPWTVNAEGQSMVFASKADAVAAVRKLETFGMRSIDVGCMQVNLMHHPEAFASLELAFDPQANASYAARFLMQLFERTGAWPAATAHYHSATPDLGADYGRKVAAVWPDEKRRSDALPLTSAYGWATAPMEGGPRLGRAPGLLFPPRGPADLRAPRPQRPDGWTGGAPVRPSVHPANVTMAFYRAPDAE